MGQGESTSADNKDAAMPAAKILALILLTAPAALAPAAALAEDDAPLLTLSATGEARGVPDAADITIRVESQAATSGEAMADTSARMTAVLAAVKAQGVAARDIATTDVSLYPRRERQEGKPETLSYVSATAIRVRVQAFDRLGDVIDAATRAGASQLDGPNFVIADIAPLEEAARAHAVARLFAKARTMACAAGMGLGRLVALSEGGASVPGPQPRMMMEMKADSARMAPPIEAGERDVSASVSGAWELTADATGACPAPK
ncbi:MAG: hypothetical protein ACJA1L_003113 [Paracoccaceae bacterium]